MANLACWGMATESRFRELNRWNSADESWGVVPVASLFGALDRCWALGEEGFSWGWGWDFLTHGVDLLVLMGKMNGKMMTNTSGFCGVFWNEVPYGTLKSGSSIFFQLVKHLDSRYARWGFSPPYHREVKLGVKATGKKALPTRPTFMGIHPKVTESILDRSDVEGGPLTPKHHWHIEHLWVISELVLAGIIVESHWISMNWVKQ